jgi:NAD(P)-dependent dehydrogenase (short-subunit alcohol dehydrogenase family)
MSELVVITGTSRGIGLALAEKFIQGGFTVIGTRRTGKVESLHHSQFSVLPLDLTDLISIKSFAENLKQKEIYVDIFINNAGIGPDLDTLIPEIDSFQQTLAVNLTGTVFLTEQILPQIKKNGKIINISSKMGSIEFCVGTDSTAYRLSKAALNMYTKILANRLSPQQSVAAIHPGWVRTTITKSCENGRLSTKESASKIFDFALSNFNPGIFWNIETQSSIPW